MQEIVEPADTTTAGESARIDPAATFTVLRSEGIERWVRCRPDGRRRMPEWDETVGVVVSRTGILVVDTGRLGPGHGGGRSAT